MKLTGLFFFAGLVAAFAQKLVKPKVDQPVVCIKKEKTLDLTLVQGKDGNTGLPGPKGSHGERGPPGLTGKLKGQPGLDGLNGKPGMNGQKGDEGERGGKGKKGDSGAVGMKGERGEYGDPGDYGPPGPRGCPGETGLEGDKGDRGPHGLPALEDIKDLLIHALNDYKVTESGYYNRLYHVTARDLTDGRTDTGGWGSATGKTGNYIQATFLRPVYVTSVTVAGGYIPSWNTRTTRNHGKLKLEYSTDGKNWKTGTTTFRTPVGKRMVTIKFQSITAQYWRLISTENKWAGTTEFALKPLIKP